MMQVEADAGISFEREMHAVRFVITICKVIRVCKGRDLSDDVRVVAPFGQGRIRDDGLLNACALPRNHMTRKALLPSPAV